jgi:hypothetical protein
MEIDMENDIVKNLTDELSNLSIKILDYIESTENWLFYWIDNKEVQNFVEAYPVDYEFMAHVSIKNISGSPLVDIDFDEHPDGIESIERYAPLYFFRETANANWLKWNGKVQELKRLEIEKEIQFHKRRIAELESELK